MIIGRAGVRSAREVRRVAGEVQPGDELAAAAHPDFVEDRFEVVLDGPRRQVQLRADGRGGQPARDERGDGALPRAEPVRARDEGQEGFRSVAWEDDWTTGLLVDDYTSGRTADLGAVLAAMSPQWQSRQVADGWASRSSPPTSGRARSRWTSRRGRSSPDPAGNVLGAFLAALLYDTVGPALLATLRPDEFQSTLQMNVDFLRPIRPGHVRGRGRVRHRDGDHAVLEASLVDAEGAVLASATAIARVIGLDAARGAV